MNVLAAMKDTLALWTGQSWADIDLPESLSGKHMVDMLTTVETGEFSYGKQCRWLGWMQAATVAAGIATLDDMKAINKRHAGDETQAMAGEREALVEKIASALWFEYVDDMGYPNGQATWPEMVASTEAFQIATVALTRRQAESALRIARPDLFGLSAT